MHVRTLGISQVTVGTEVIGTERPTVFALLFMLAMAHPRPISRARLACSLWPAAQPATRHHRLRTLLYRARQIGAPCTADDGQVALSQTPIVDFREFVTRPVSMPEVEARLSSIGPVLPGVDALSAAGPAELFDDARDTIAATMARWLRLALTLARNGGNWPLVARLARAALDVDAHDHEAWEYLVEAECITSGRRHALQTVDQYLANGPVDDASRHSALALQRRIIAEGVPGTDDPPLVGREAAMTRIWTAIARAERGQGGALLLWGPAGVGKTRLLAEIERVNLAARARAVCLTTRPVHALQPLGLVRNLTERLLNEPGAAGCEPTAFQRLRRFLAPNESGEWARAESVEVVFAAITELLAALTDEAPLIIAVDDVHMLDTAAWPLWRAAVRWSATRRLLWVFSFRALSDGELKDLPDPALLGRVRIAPLERSAATELLHAIDGHASPERCERMLNTSSGYPLLLHAAADPFDAALTARAEAAVEDTITRLSPSAAALLVEVSSTDGGATRQDLTKQLDTDAREVSATIAELERAGMMYESDAVLMTYGIWADAVSDRVGPLRSVF